MYELIRVSDHCYYIQCPAKIGLVEIGEGQVCLIDSGNDKSAGKKVRKILEEKGWQLAAIYNTHSHADHIGGNQYLQGQTGCRIYAPGIECDFTNHPVLEPTFLYGGDPPKELRHKFLMARESEALPLTEEVLPRGWEILPLAGHSFDMVGFRTSEDVVYLADCLSSEQTLEKYRISYLTDVAAYLKTLEAVKDMEAACFIPAHAEPGKDMAPLAQRNIDQVLEIGEKILALCGEALPFEEILKGLFDAYGLTLDFEQYVLVGSTVKSYLTWLKEAGKLQVRIEDNRLLWERN